MARITFIAASVFLVLAPAGAMAQWNNQPFEFRRASGGGGGVGMSPAYRQAIIEKKLLGRTPRNLVRDANGFLLEAERGPNDQAFLRQQAQPFLASGHGLGFGFGGVSFGASASGTSLGAAYGMTEGAPLFMSWASMISVDGVAVTWGGNGGPSYTPASAVIESWIAQLPSLDE